MSIKSVKGMRKGRRRGIAGDDVTDNQDYIEEVVPEEDDSYVVEGTDSPEGIERESEIIDDDHNVVLVSDEGTEEEFMAESEDGEAELIDEDGGESREGRRKGRKVARRGVRRGVRRGESDEDEEDIDELEEDLEEREGRRKGRKVARRGVRRGVRRGDTIDVVTDEEGNTEEVDLPEPDEREGRRRGIRRGSRRGSVYGGRSPEHQESIRSAVSVAMKDRRL